jgi:hypothetical protein
LLRKWIRRAPELQRDTVYPYGAALAETIVPRAMPVVLGFFGLGSSLMEPPLATDSAGRGVEDLSEGQPPIWEAAS